MCTGDNFARTECADCAPAGTKCAALCVLEKGNWGSSWCYTKIDKSQWGAECIKCPGMILT